MERGGACGRTYSQLGSSQPSLRSRREGDDCTASRLIGIILLLLALIPAFAASQPAIPNRQLQTTNAPPSDLLQFLDGGSLHGELRGMDPQRGVQWQHPAAKRTIRLKPDNIAWINFETAERVASGTGPTCWFEFSNGDAIFGQLKAIENDKLKLETWFGGNLEAPRQALHSITFFSKGFSILYEGPNGVDGWKLERGAKGWQYRDGAFIANSVGIMGRDLKLSGSAGIEFDVAWTGQISLSFILYAESIDRFDYSTSCYMFHLSPPYMNLQRVQSGAGVMSLGPQAYLPEMLKKSKVRLEIRVNKEEATITVLADGILVNRWKDPAGFVGKGSGIVFSSQSEGPTIKLSNFKVAEWDGAFEPRSMTNAVPKDDLVYLANRDKVSGTLQNIRDGKLTFAIPQTTLEIPMQRVTQIFFGQQTSNSLARVPWEIRANVAGGGSVAFQLEEWADAQVLGKSAIFGQMALNPKSIRQIRFNPQLARAPGEGSALPNEETWEIDE